MFVWNLAPASWSALPCHCAMYNRYVLYKCILLCIVLYNTAQATLSREAERSAAQDWALKVVEMAGSGLGGAGCEGRRLVVTCGFAGRLGDGGSWWWSVGSL